MKLTNNTILLADSGSTKTDWLLFKGRSELKRIQTQGINPFMLESNEIEVILRNDLLQENINPDAIFFYGAGCCGDQSSLVQDVLHTVFSNSSIQVDSDLLGAARSVCGKEPGIACILGTGSNSCYYDGSKIVENVSPLGYILGDEGSGAVMGKLLLGNILKHQLPQEIEDKFFRKYKINPHEIIKKVYKESFPNRFLASFAPFIGENRNNYAIHRLIIEEFERFFRRNIDQYHRPTFPVNFVGSIAFYLRVELQEVAMRLGYRIGRIYRSPLDGLMKFYQN